MSGMLRKILREVWLPTLLFAAAFLLVEVFMNRMIPQMMLGQPRVIPVDLLPSKLISAVLGARIDGGAREIVLAHFWQTLVWFHPAVFAVLGGYTVLVCTRFPVAEIDRGSIDVLLSLPVSRRRIYLCETIAWLVGGWILLAAGGLGYAIGSGTMQAADRLPLGVVLLILCNLLCLYVAIGGLAFFISSLSERRLRAVAIVFGLMLAWYLLDVLAVFWSPVQQLAFLNPLTYYRPMPIMQTGAVPMGHILTLLGAGAVAGIAGCEVTARRSICTV